MPARYVKDPEGVVHVVSPVDGDDHTYCSRSLDGDDRCLGFLPVHVDGPCTCLNCKTAIDNHREHMRGARWGRLIKQDLFQ